MYNEKKFPLINNMFNPSELNNFRRRYFDTDSARTFFLANKRLSLWKCDNSARLQ